MTTFVDPDVTGIRADAICPPGACDWCDEYWSYYEARYAPEDPDAVARLGQVTLNDIAEVAN